MKSWVGAFDDPEHLQLHELRAVQRACDRLFAKAISNPEDPSLMMVALHNRQLYSTALLALIIRTDLELEAAKEARKAWCARHCGRPLPSPG